MLLHVWATYLFSFVFARGGIEKKVLVFVFFGSLNACGEDSARGRAPTMGGARLRAAKSEIGVYIHCYSYLFYQKYLKQSMLWQEKRGKGEK